MADKSPVAKLYDQIHNAKANGREPEIVLIDDADVVDLACIISVSMMNPERQDVNDIIKSIRAGEMKFCSIPLAVRTEEANRGTDKG